MSNSGMLFGSGIGSGNSPLAISFQGPLAVTPTDTFHFLVALVKILIIIPFSKVNISLIPARSCNIPEMYLDNGGTAAQVNHKVLIVTL